MKITASRNKFIFQCSYDEREHPKKYGFRWNSTARQWETSDMAMVIRAVEKGGITTDIDIAKIQSQQTEIVAKSTAVSADIDVPSPDGLSFRPFQQAGISYAAEHTNTLIADEMGLGKTIQAIGIINVKPEIHKILIVCPASLKLNWQRECEKWLTRSLSIGIAGADFPNADIVIINYDMLKKHSVAIRAVVWDLLVCDESHYLKSYTAQRTKEVIGNKKKGITPIIARQKIFLTGTPILNRPIELWTTVSALCPEIFSNWQRYVTRYCAGEQTKFGWDVSGASNLDELQEKLRASIMVRRLKADVLIELPAKQRQVIEIPANGAKKAIDAENAAWQAQQDMLLRLKAAVKTAKAGTEEEYREAVRNLRDGTRLAFGEIAKLRHATAMTKLPSVIAHIQDCLESSDKIIVMAHHHDIIDEIQKEFMDISVVLTGKTTIEDRQAAIDKFQTDKNCRLFIGSIKAAGVGITLTAAAHVIFAELDWTPANISQAEDRCHRIGQTESVLIQHLVLEGSLDAKMAKMLVEKQEIISDILDSEDVIVPEIKDK